MIGKTNVKVKPNKKVQYVEYIESTGTQYIDTGIVPTSNIKIEANMMALTFNSSNYCSFFGADTTGIRAFVADGMFYFTIGSSLKSSVEVEINKKYKITANDNGTAYIDDGEPIISNDPSTISATSSIKIFAITNDSSIWGESRLYDLKIYDGSTIVRDYIPALDHNNVVCLYDKVSKTCFYNAGTGDFLGGVAA